MPPHRFYCTYFDSAYLLKGLALYRSLRRTSDPFTLFVLCWDDMSLNILQRLALPGMECMAAAELEDADPDLCATRAGRTRAEYFWTTSPALPLFLLRRQPAIDLITYLDADVAFFASPEAIFEELGSGSIYITPHHFSPRHAAAAETSGVYNVAAVTFRNDAHGRECLEWWRERCLEWCYARVEPGRFGDQKYLDDWPTRFSGVVSSTRLGVNLAPWNVEGVRVSHTLGQLHVNGEPVVFYHYHGFRELLRGIYELTVPGYRLNRALRRAIYRPYIQTLDEVRALAPHASLSARTGFRGRGVGALIRAAREGRLLLRGRRSH